MNHPRGPYKGIHCDYLGISLTNVVNIAINYT